MTSVGDTVKRTIATMLVVASTNGFCASSTARENTRQLYFGETHMHTAYSLDAYIGGNRQTPSDAYRAARGETVVVNGVPHQIRRPLDFAAVTDHAEYIGEMYSTLNANAPGHDNLLLEELRNLSSVEDREQWFFKYVISNNRGDTPTHPSFYAGEETARSAWKLTIAAAEEHYQPGEFTTFVAYEWSAAPKGGNLHRNILFRSDKAPDLPKSYIEINREEELWDWLAALDKQGIKGMAIPHNSNASKGMMFPDHDSTGKVLDKDYAQKREAYERVIEMLQVKGNSEVHRKFWAADEFADFENADSIQQSSGRTFAKGNFVRSGVTKGLALEKQLGINPFKLGFVGGTDNHNGMMGDVDEDNFVGAHGPEDGTIPARREGSVTGWINSRELSIGSLTGVWARNNTRNDIWDAIYHRETFASSGPRIGVRFFGSWDFDKALHTQADAVERAYRVGVPMGGDLENRPDNGVPHFLVMASKDALGANLDRIQVVKAWVNESGQLMDRVFDVAWSGQRKVDDNGKLAPVGNTVDLGTATYLNSIGAGQLAAVWKDPEFDPTQSSLYYLRVIEIPTPRWTTYDAVRSRKPLLTDVAATIQERAWSSPIWYKP